MICHISVSLLHPFVSVKRIKTSENTTLGSKLGSLSGKTIPVLVHLKEPTGAVPVRAITQKNRTQANIG